MKCRLFLTAILFLAIVGCAKIEELSDDASLKSVTLIDHSPQSIVLGEIEISDDTIYIPVEYGKYQFPLTVEVDFAAAAGAYIYGVGKATPITFESIDDEPVRFVVSAENGFSKNYYLSLLEVPLSDDCELFDSVSFSDADNENILLRSELMSSDDDQDCKMIVALDTDYPVTLTPQFSVAPTSTIRAYSVDGSDQWDEFNNGETELTFEDEDQCYQLEIVSESGNSQICQVGLSVVAFSAVDQTMMINYRDLSVTTKEESGVTAKSLDIDFESGEITVLLDSDDDIEFPLDVSLDVPINEWLSYIGASQKQEYTFDSWDDEHSFALFYEENMTAARWSVSIKRYEAADEPISIESATINDFSCGTYTFIVTFNHLTRSTTKAEPVIYEQSREILLYYGSYYEPSLVSLSNWWAEFNLGLTLSDGTTLEEDLRWAAVANSSGDIKSTEIRAALATTQYIDVEQEDGSVVQWSVKLVADATADSSECELLGLSIVEARPNYVEFQQTAYTINESESIIYFNIGDRFGFPMSIDLDYEISPYATVSPSTLYFADEESEPTITILAQDGTSTKEYKAKLIVPQESVAPAINSITFGELVQGASYVGDVEIDAENYNIVIGVETSDNLFPLDVPISSVDVADDGVFATPTSGAITFSSAQSKAMVWVSSADGVARQLWSFEIFYYQQLDGGDMDSWELDASPVTSSLPWSTPNMSGIASVKNTNPVDGRYGGDGDYAAEMQTGTSWGQLASGSIFTGWFDKDNSTSYGLSDPVFLTHFGTPFTPDAKIKGVSADISYSQAADGVDWGSLYVILINEDPTAKYEFHGNKPNDYDDPTAGSAPHPSNTAVEVALSKMIFGNGTATQTSYGDEISMNVEAGEWVEVFIPITTDEPFTHISVAAASSAYGDYFIGVVGSVMMLDNVKIIYE